MQQRSVQPAADRRQLGGCLLGLPELAGSQQDAHARPEQPGPAQAARAVQRLPDPGSRLSGAALGQPQQGQARLGRREPPTRLLEAAERLLLLPAEPVQLGQLVIGTAGRGVLAEGPARALRLVHGFGPRALDRHDLGAVHQALPAVRREPRLLEAPPVQRRRPLPRPGQVEDQLAGLDHRAVEDAAHLGRDLARGHGHHRLVERSHPGGDLAPLDQRLPAAQRAECGEVPIAVPTPDRGDLGGERQRRLDLAGPQPHERVGHQHHAPLRVRSALDPVEQLGRPGEPRARAHVLSTQQHHDPHPGGTTRRLARLVGGQPRAIGAGADIVCLLVPAHEVRRAGQQVQVGGRERRDPVGLGQLGVGVRPHPRAERLPPPFAPLVGHPRNLHGHCSTTGPVVGRPCMGITTHFRGWWVLSTRAGPGRA